MKIKSYHPFAAATILFWSLAFVLTRLALQSFSPYSLGFLRYLSASTVLVAVALATKMKLPEKRDIPWFLLSGATGFFLYMITFNTGSITVNSSTSSVVIASAPLITALSARVFYKEKLSVIQAVGIGVSFVGVIVLTVIGGGITVNSGILWLIAAAVLLSAYNLVQKKLTKKYSALQVTSYSIFAGTLMLAAFSPTAFTEIKAADAKSLACVVLLGVFSSAVAYVCWAKAFSKAKNTASVSNYMFVTPFLATVFGMLLGGEKLELSTVAGGIVILSGLLVYNLGNFRHRKSEKCAVSASA